MEWVTNILKPFVGWLFKFFKERVLPKIKFWKFRYITRKPPLDKDSAFRIALSILSGSIEMIVPFRNIGSKKIYLAGLRSERNVDSYTQTVFILEQIGHTYRAIWQKDIEYSFIIEIQVVDIDKDGIHEVSYIQQEGGTGVDYRTLYLYSMKHKKQFFITESRLKSDSASPLAPKVEVAEDTDEKFIEKLSEYALEQGFLQSKVIDFDDPNHAVETWHNLNGRKKSGMVKIKFYKGKPVYAASTIAELDTHAIIWISYFKGPLFGYIKSDDRHFVAYSPDDMYNWITCLAYDGEHLLFVTHSASDVYALTFDRKQVNLIHSNDKNDGRLFPRYSYGDFDRRVSIHGDKEALIAGLRQVGALN